MKAWSIFGVVAFLLASSLGADKDHSAAAGQSDQKSAPIADSQGNLHVPADYRSLYQYLGSWAIANDKAPGSKQIHIVYTSPGSIAAYRRNRHFPDGSVLVKEVYESATGLKTTGTVSHPQTLKGWFVMVKDSKDSNPGNKLWGSGWGWSWFDADKPFKTTSTDYKTDCQACHVPARGSDWIYVEGYPQLRPQP